MNLNMYGNKMYDLMEKLFPICRSITGDGVRDTLNIIKDIIPIEIKEIPSGTKVFDWEVPYEWNIKDAWIKNSKGKKIIDFKDNNLHIIGYSIPIHRKMFLGELKNHLFTLKEKPHVIPYRTSYYKQNWGFCITHNHFKKLENDYYEVFIDSTLKKGSLTYAELKIDGSSKNEILFSTYICHPSLCNDNLSGIAFQTYLIKYLLEKKDLKYSYRFLFIPETIGSIVWIYLNQSKLNLIKYGFIISCIGDSGKINFKKTKKGDTELDRIIIKVLQDNLKQNQYFVRDFTPMGSDDRQFCSIGVNIPMVTLNRTPPKLFPEYHTSKDTLDIIDVEGLNFTFDIYKKIISIIENNKTYINKCIMCEPNLGSRGLYTDSSDKNVILKWVLSMSDGSNSLLDISIRSRLNFEKIKDASDRLEDKDLLGEKIC